MKFKNWIFDLDGTLVWTKPKYRYKIVGKVLRDLRVNFSKDKIDEFWFGKDREEIIRKNFNVDPEIFWKVYLGYDCVGKRELFTLPYEDVDFIEELKQKGCKTGIVTGAPDYITFLEIEMLGKEKFDGVVIAHRFEKIQPKPHPEGLEKCLNLLKGKKEETIYVGNGEEDIETANRAGVYGCLIVREEHSPIDTGISLVVHSLYELRKFFR